MPIDDDDDFGPEDDVVPVPAPVLPVSVSTDEDVDPVTGLVLASTSDTVEDSGEILLP